MDQSVQAGVDGLATQLRRNGVEPVVVPGARDFVDRFNAMDPGSVAALFFVGHNIGSTGIQVSDGFMTPNDVQQMSPFTMAAGGVVTWVTCGSASAWSGTGGYLSASNFNADGSTWVSMAPVRTQSTGTFAGAWSSFWVGNVND